MVFLPDWTVHPGEILQEWADNHGLTADQLAMMTDNTVADMRTILRGEAPITADMASTLHLATAITAELWLSMQRSYDDFHAGRRR